MPTIDEVFQDPISTPIKNLIPTVGEFLAYDHPILLRNQAVASGMKRYFTGVPCPRGHVCERVVSSRGCVICRRLAVAARRKLPMFRVRENKRKRLLSQGLSGSDKRRRWNRRIKLTHQKKVDWYIIRSLRTRLRDALRGGQRVGSAIRDLGCTIPEFKSYIAAKFTDGMTWNNHGAWHLDHIRPLASFNLKDRSQFLGACHYTNYQPLWAADNLAKGARTE